MQVSEAHRTLVKTGWAKLDRVEVTDDIHVSFRSRIPVNRPFTDTEKLERLGLSTDRSRFDPFEYISRSARQKSAKELIQASEVKRSATHSPDKKKLYVDLGAERLIAAEKNTEKIAVEIKSFTRPSALKDLEEALGQFVLYAQLLKRFDQRLPRTLSNRPE